MSNTAVLAFTLMLGCLVGCGGGGGNGTPGIVTPSLSFSANPTTISVSGSFQKEAPQPTILLTLFGTMPSAGVYYGWNNSTNMISSIYDTQIGSDKVSLTVIFASPAGKPIGAIYDTINIFMARDKLGQDLIAGSPQTIQVTYQVDYPPAALFQTNPASASAGGPGFTLTVTGQGFPTDAQVQWNGSPLATSWVSSTTLQAQVPASAITHPGSAQLTVGGQDLQTSEALFFPVANTQASVLEGGMACAWDPVHGILYNSMVSTSDNQAPVIQAIDPSTGTVITQSACGTGYKSPLTGATVLAVSDDGGYLYAYGYNMKAGVPQSILRYLLPSLTLDTSFSVPMVAADNWVMAMVVAPGAPRTLAVALGKGGNAAGVEILDDGVPRGPLVLTPATPFYVNSLTWGTDASMLYVLSGTWSKSYQLSTVAVPSGGPIVRATQPVALGSGGWGIHWVPATGYVYADSGQVFDPATGNLVGTCGSGNTVAMNTDLGQGLGFYLTPPLQEPTTLAWGFEVTSHNLATLGSHSSTFLPSGKSLTSNGGGAPTKVLRCGPSTLVLYGGYQYLNPIYILSGPFAQGK